MTLSWFVPGPVVPKARARTVVLPNGKRSSYTPARTRAYEELIGQHYRAAYPGRKMIPAGIPLSVEVVAWLKPQKGRAWPTGRPDGDNLCKAACDAATGLVFADDAQVVRMVVEKRYSGAPTGQGMEITVRLMGV